jgi:hypothetical protein
VTLVIDGHDVPARVWQGATESGVPVQCFMIRIAPEIPASDPRFGELAGEFVRELEACADPRATIDAIPLRMII